MCNFNIDFNVVFNIVFKPPLKVLSSSTVYIGSTRDLVSSSFNSFISWNAIGVLWNAFDLFVNVAFNIDMKSFQKKYCAMSTSTIRDAFNGESNFTLSIWSQYIEVNVESVNLASE